MDQVAAEASPSADGPEPAEDEADAPMAEMAIPVGSEPSNAASSEAHQDAPPRVGDVMPPSNKSAPAAPAARWDPASDTVSFDRPAVERTAAQDGPNQAMAKLLLAARTEGAHSRWPF